MRDIRARIVKQTGIDLSDHQIQELAARRLEAVLDVRSLNPMLMEQLRRSAGGRSVSVPARTVETPQDLEESRLFEGGLRGVFKGILKLFFLNPRPLIDALNAQAKANADIARRQAERDQQQIEWNALHYELLKRLVTEVSRVSLEAQGAGLRMESLSTKVDFNERRVRGLEGTVHESAVKTTTSAPAQRQTDDLSASPISGGDGAGTADGQRRRRRRRRGRRTGPGEFGSSPVPAAGGPETAPTQGEDDGGLEDDGAEDIEPAANADDVSAAAPADAVAPAPIEPPQVPTQTPDPSAAQVADARPDDPIES